MNDLIILPFYYTFKTRYNSISGKIGYILTNILPIYLYIYTFLKEKSLLKITIITLIAMCSYMSIYEIGYIFNDTITIKKEKNPTLRLTFQEILSVQKKIKKIVVQKIIVSLIFIFFLKLILKEINIYNYIITFMLTISVYCIHNFYRNSKITYITFFLLSTLRFFSPVSFVLPLKLNFSYLIPIVLYNSLIRNFEQIGNEKYKFKKLNINKNKNGFRVGYYLLMICILKLYPEFLLKNFKNVLYYLFIYRVLIYLFLKLKLNLLNNLIMKKDSISFKN